MSMMTLKMKEDEFNIRLIKFVQQRPCLYDHNRSDYTNRHVQEAAWLDISKKTNESVADCKERWKNLRGCYTRHLKKINRLAGGPFPKYFKPYYLAEQLQFLNSYTKPRSPIVRFRRGPVSDMDQETQNDVDEYSDNSHDVETPPPAPSSSENTEANKWDVEDFLKSKGKVKDPKKVSLSEVNASALDYFKSRKNNLQYDRNQDPDLAFMCSLLPDVRHMNRDQKLRFKSRVLNLIGEILQENNQEYPANT